MLIEIIFVLVGVLGWVTFDWVWALIGGYVVFFSFYIIWGVLATIMPTLKTVELTGDVYYGTLAGFFGAHVLQKLYCKYFKNGEGS